MIWKKFIKISVLIRSEARKIAVFPLCIPAPFVIPAKAGELVINTTPCHLEQSVAPPTVIARKLFSRRGNLV